MIFVALTAGLWIRTRFRRLLDDARLHWIDALPLASTTRFLYFRLRAIVPTIAFAAGIAALVPFEVDRIAPLLVGMVVGATAALVVPVRRDVPYPASRYRMDRPDPAQTPGLTPLTADLSVAIAARLKPKTIARSLIPFLLVAPSGIAPVDALAMGLGLAVALYLQALSAALKDCRDGADVWAASLPVPRAFLLGRWRRAARIRAVVAVVVLAIPLEAVLPLPAVVFVLLAALLWIEWHASGGERR